MHPFTHRHKPKRTSEIIGQDDAVSKLKAFASNFSNEKKNAAFLYGPPGTGKTSAAHAIASEMGYEVVEVNASDFRNADEINMKVGHAMKQMSLFSRGKLILVDEVDGLSGHQDRGGVQAIVKLLGDSKFPVVLTATNPFDNKFSSLRSKSVMIEFAELGHESLHKILKSVCEKENIAHQDDVLKIFARRSAGDARAAINDLEALTKETKALTKESLEEMVSRNRNENIMHALNKIFKTTDPKIAIGAFENVDEDLDQQLLWIDENLPKEYSNADDLAQAYDKLSKADIFSRRIRRWQHWRFLVYINALITAGIAVSKKEKYRGIVEYKPTGRILKMWWANQRNAKKKAIAQKIAEKTHSSSKDIIKSTMPYLPIMFRSKSMARKLTAELELEDEEVEWLVKKA
jgi:replication factor C large subunit